MPKRAILLSLVLLFLLLSAIPIALSLTDTELVPPELEETVTLYVSTNDARLTREYELERSATSVVVTIPFEDEPLPGDANYTPPPGQSIPNSDNSQGSNTQLVALSVTQAPIMGTSNIDLRIYSCPDASSSTDDSYSSGVQFSAIGHAFDEQNILYLLIEDAESTTPQTWLRVTQLSLLELEAPYTELPVMGCENIASDTEIDGATPTPTSDMPRLPSAITATPVLQSSQIIITNEDAQRQIEEVVEELDDPEVTITGEDILITGTIDIEVGLGVTLDGHVEIVGEFVEFVNERDFNKLGIEVTSLTVAGRDYTDSDEERSVEFTINNWLESVLVAQDVISYVQSDGVLTIDVLGLSPDAEETPEVTAEVTAEPEMPTQSATLILRTLDTSFSPTPLPLRTIDPNAPTPTPTSTSEPDQTTQAERSITETDATLDAIENIDSITGISIAFEEDELIVQGFFRPGGVFGNNSVPILIAGDVTSNNGMPQFVPQELTIQGQSMNVGLYPNLSQSITNWLVGYVGTNVSSLNIEDGTLFINNIVQD